VPYLRPERSTEGAALREVWAPAMSAVAYSSVTLNFKIHYPGKFDGPDNLDTLLDALKVSYIAGQLDTELFEEQVDAFLRFRDRIDWWTWHAYLTLSSDELERYPHIVEWTERCSGPV
jgi:hypothetical protein